MRSIFFDLGSEELLPPPSGWETALRGGRLTNTEDEENIINCPDGPTYPDEKSVSRSGATP